jgi:nucleotide-binding universal stress UspA family protein
MTAFRGPVLAAIDLTDTADEVLAQAGAIATALQARLIVCHVLREMLRVRMVLPQLSRVDTAMHAALYQRARDVVEARVVAVTRSTTDFEVAIDSGSAQTGILSQAEQAGAGVVVIGPGTVADRVARYAPCPVLIARLSAHGGVLGATDFSDPFLPAIEAAAAEASRRGVGLRLIHCVDAAEPIALGSPAVAARVLPALPLNVIEELENDARQRLRTSLARFGVSGDCLIARGRAAVAIVEAAREVPTELVVIGIRRRSKLSRLLLGSVAEAVLNTAPCSVLVVHLECE